MNAIKLYVSAARLILGNDHYDYSVCNEINNMFPNLEQSLSCTVCKNILKEPYSPTETTCQHHVCKTCVGGRKRLRPSCSWCKDYTKYVKNSQLQCLLACYKGLCDYIKCTNLLTQLNDLFPPESSDKNIINMVQKGTELSLISEQIKLKNEKPESQDDSERNDDCHCGRFPKCSSSSVCQTYMHDHSVSSENESSCDQFFSEVPLVKSEPDSTKLITLADKRVDSVADKIETLTPRFSSVTEVSNVFSGDKSSDSASEELNPKELYSVSFSGTRSKIILKRRPIATRQEVENSSGYFVSESKHVQELPVSHMLRSMEYPSRQNSILTNEHSRFRKSKIKTANNTDRPNCRCGNATPKPGKLTCCGQRCACYMQSKACSGCRCRGCRNPHMIDGVKVLGRFMKEDNEVSESNLVIGSASSFPDLSASFLNQQVSQVLPNMCSNSLLNIS